MKIDEITVSATDFLITGMVYRKWYNPMRYIKGKLIRDACIGRFVAPCMNVGMNPDGSCFAQKIHNGIEIDKNPHPEWTPSSMFAP